MLIKVTTDPDSFYGPNGDEWDGAKESYDNYKILLANAIHSEYPEAEIEFFMEPTMTPIEVIDDGIHNDAIRDIIYEIDCVIYNDGDFWSV